MNHLNSHHKKMKKTFRVNIGKRPFIIDEDAYETLKEYLDQISIRLNADESTEIMDDIENRIADLFQEKLSSRVQVVDINAVNRVIAIIGNAKEFGDPIRTNENHNTTETTINDDTIMDQPVSTPRRLQRDRYDRIIGGVCAGIGKYYDIEARWIRLLSVILLFFTGGIVMVVYIILWIVLPLSSQHDDNMLNA